MGLTSFLLSTGRSGILTSLSILGCVTKLLFASKLDGFVGLVGHGTLGVGMILKFFVPL
jgi:hypothetical protein